MHVSTRTACAVRRDAEFKLENPSVSMDEAEGRLVGLGNKIVSRNDEKRTFTVAQAIQTTIIEAGTFIPDVEAVKFGLLPPGTVLVACTAKDPDCHSGTAFMACDGGCVRGLLPEGGVCGKCDGGGNMLGGSCGACGGYGLVKGS